MRATEKLATIRGRGEESRCLSLACQLPFVPKRTSLANGLRIEIVKLLKEKVFGIVRDKNTHDVNKLNSLIAEFAPERKKGEVIILAMGPRARPDSGKISNPEKFFPSFCKVLAQCGISSVYVHGMDGLEDLLSKQGSTSTILINLIHELYDNLDDYELPNRILQNTSAVFNSCPTARIIRDKRRTNLFLSNEGVPMPILDPENEKIFSNARIGTNERVIISDTSGVSDKNRYNTKFIDTQIKFEQKIYYTCIRLVCIGSMIVQIYVRASDIENGNPSVHNADTPRDRNLLDNLYDLLVFPQMQNFESLAQKIESALGPGFYVHDVLVEKETGNVYLSEVGFKFFDQSYFDPMMGVTDDRNFLTGVMDMETYAAYAASVFVTYCAGKGFI